jgi:hypothetical protein
MTTEQLRKAYDAQPFQPLALYLAGGRVIQVPHRDFMLLPPTVPRTFGVAGEHGVIETIDLLLVVSIKPLPGRSQAGRRKAG